MFYKHQVRTSAPQVTDAMDAAVHVKVTQFLYMVFVVMLKMYFWG